MGMSKNYSLKSPFCGKIRARSNTCFIGPLRVHMPNGVSIGLAVTNRRTRGGGSNLKVGAHGERRAQSDFTFSVKMNFNHKYNVFLYFTFIYKYHFK